ncbi:PA14 domain-containing protein [Filimonas effusa]|uniref:PA14 domain-containing protein n=1 Tax=Filimonas effusa TaxID=2508721 RepID=A0A4Q1DBE6_9BACT|nr:PA14 domain-containing protein [Filimonas effusa]RXK85903.1 hypothetical protein ESB13_03580 [Filimonas effusa]
MILFLTCKYKKEIALVFLLVFYSEFVLAAHAMAMRSCRSEAIQYYMSYSGKAAMHCNHAPEITLLPAKAGLAEDAVNELEDNGPSQPEMQAFQAVGANNMVDLFSGDFSYNIPLMDVGGYPINIAYKSGVTMEEDASWTGLGWNINPGTITRNMRGLPDDFSGKQDTIARTISIRDNRTIGGTFGADIELAGNPKQSSGGSDSTKKFWGKIGASIGVFHNTYAGWGMETGLNASINAGRASKGPFSGALSFTNNSQSGYSITPSASFHTKMKAIEADINSCGIFSLSMPYNSRAGLRGIQLSAGLQQWKQIKAENYSASSSFTSLISFATPSYTPTMSYPMTSTQYSFTIKLGGEAFTVHPSGYLSGYESIQKIEAGDKRMTLPAFGYLNAQQAGGNFHVLHDFNREKDMPYREKPEVPNIAVPSYTYDLFSITGEGTGGMFRAYRGDIGFVHDNYLSSKDASNRFSIDLGGGNLVHGGTDLNINRATTQTGPWVSQNTMMGVVAPRNSSALFEAAYFRNPGDKTVSSKEYFNTLGGDDLVTVKLKQNGSSDPAIIASNYLSRYRAGRPADDLLLTPQNAVKNRRDKRAQVISYLTAADASEAGLDKYIENYRLNKFSLANCDAAVDVSEYGEGIGLQATYYKGKNFDGNILLERNEPTIGFAHTYKLKDDDMGTLNALPTIIDQNRKNFSARWIGRIKAPATGTYVFTTKSDDGSRLYINDSLILNDWNSHPAVLKNSVPLNLEAGKFYDIRVEYFQGSEKLLFALGWTYPGKSKLELIPAQYLYHRSTKDTFANERIVLEKRVNQFRKPSHISQINVLNPDGRRYVYGIPVYNLEQKDVSFSVDASRGDRTRGLVGYNPDVDDSPNNNQGKEAYFNKEEIPAYAHGFLLTGILSPDYSDLTGNGITEDDLGTAIKFNYSKVADIYKPFGWRAPNVPDSASYNEGFRTYSRDDKGTYSFGTKELWYLNSVVSKTMVAVFKVSDRYDLWPVNQQGKKDFSTPMAKKLDEIKLYTKADFQEKGESATPVKTVHFEYTYELCRGVNHGGKDKGPYADSGKLTLKKIWFTYNGNKKSKLNPYLFFYKGKNPSYNNNAADRWGNYKDPLQNPSSTTASVRTNAEYPYALQDSAIAAANAAAWTLDSIALPSGGKMKITYESDDYAYVQDRRAMCMFQVVGFSGSKPTSMADVSDKLYGSKDYMYVIAKVPKAVKTENEVYKAYLQGIDKVYFKLNVKMPSDRWGSGAEYVPCYAGVDLAGGYGALNNNYIWFKVKSINDNGVEDGGNISPMAKAAIQYLRLNLPSKAYPDSEVMDDFGALEAVKNIVGLAGGLIDVLRGFDNKARGNNWAQRIDNERSVVRLNAPAYTKIGGGLRVKRITIYDNWNKMSKGKKEATYGQEYDYTTVIKIDGVDTRISSGVATYEPFIGGEENPFRMPVEYTERVSVLAPVSMGYTEEPLGESFYPSPAVGYSKVRVKSIHTENVRSANGYEETEFFTAYDFPAIASKTVLNDNKKRYSPTLRNLLKIDARHYLAVTQGFRIELNDMHGKLKSQASYDNKGDVVSQTINYYKTASSADGYRRLSNTVNAISPSGVIDTAALIGKEVELMMDMRSEKSISDGFNVNVNGDMFAAGIWPVLIPSLLNLFQHEETVFNSIGTTKIIQRYGILDSVLHVEKGSRVSVANMLYDAETGDVLLTRTQNEFKDSIFSFSYPAHWYYEGMSGAYQNIGAVFNKVFIKSGKVVSGLPSADSTFFASGDEVLIGTRQKTGEGNGCDEQFATFPSYITAWVVNANETKGGPKDLYFMKRDGNMVSANSAEIKILRSGRRNIVGSIGAVTSLRCPMVKPDGKTYQLQFNADTKIIDAAASGFRQNWKVGDQLKSRKECAVQ